VICHTLHDCVHPQYAIQYGAAAACECRVDGGRCGEAPVICVCRARGRPRPGRCGRAHVASPLRGMAVGGQVGGPVRVAAAPTGAADAVAAGGAAPPPPLAPEPSTVWQAAVLAANLGLPLRWVRTLALPTALTGTAFAWAGALLPFGCGAALAATFGGCGWWGVRRSVTRLPRRVPVAATPPADRAVRRQLAAVVVVVAGVASGATEGTCRQTRSEGTPGGTGNAH